MKRLKQFLLMTPLMFFLFTSIIEVYAMNTGFSTEELSEKDKTTFIFNVNIVPLIEEPIKRSIRCFDVNEDGMIAIGQDGTDGKVLCIYSSDGVFQYGYSFKCTGSFEVEWDGRDINIYFVRSDVIVTVDQYGEILDIKQVPNTIDNNNYLTQSLHSTERVFEGTIYRVRNDMGILNWVALSYSQLVVIKPTGEEIVLYNVTSSQIAKALTGFILAVLFCLVAVIVIARQSTKSIKR